MSATKSTKPTKKFHVLFNIRNAWSVCHDASTAVPRSDSAPCPRTADALRFSGSGALGNSPLRGSDTPRFSRRHPAMLGCGESPRRPAIDASRRGRFPCFPWFPWPYQTGFQWIPWVPWLFQACFPWSLWPLPDYRARTASTPSIARSLSRQASSTGFSVSTRV